MTSPPPPPPENLAVYEIIWTNVVKPDRQQRTLKYGACTFHAG